MSEQNLLPTERRCPACDSVVTAQATICLMCGTPLPAQVVAPEPEQPQPESPPVLPVTESALPIETAVPSPVSPPEPEPAAPLATAPPDVVESVMIERQSPVVVLFTAVFAIIIFVLAVLVWQYRPDEVSMIIAPSVTPIPPTITYTPTWTPLPTDTRPPTQPPTITPTPAPTETPRPPRSHSVASGETLFGLSIFYRVSPDSIGEINGFAPDAQLQVGQNLQIPWPTATPPLEIITLEVNGELVIADPRACERYEVKGGDSIVGIATQFGIQPVELLAQVNRITEASIIQPGDTLCIPQIVYGSLADLPPTPGPSPTPTLTPPPAGPQLLYPANGSTVEPPDGLLALQWVAVQDLAAEEWYMVEMTDEDVLDELPRRGFTRDNVFRAPASWRPDVPETHRMCWQVSIIQVTDMRADGLPIYTFGGESSAPSCFFWMGDFPTPTPTPTFTPSPTPTATP